MLQYSSMAQRCDNGSNEGDEWVFGYGSLIFKVDFPYLERSAASVEGWERRFWQGSHDHRGTPEAPGRVLTLIARAGIACAGMAYRVRQRTLLALDYREKNGYQRQRIDMLLATGQRVHGLTYVAPPGNPAFLGPASDEVIARQMLASRGPSGSNADYVIELAAALQALGEDDAHVFGLAALVKQIQEMGKQ
ncbi:MAG: gamma-glutamylcyclotransferase [Lysobacterales bacterium]